MKKTITPISFAKINKLSISPQKLNLTSRLVVGKDIDTAIAILSNTNNKSAPMVSEAVKSAAANAEYLKGISRSKLYISEIIVNKGPGFKRYMPQPRGMAHEIYRPTAHIYVAVSVRETK